MMRRISNFSATLGFAAGVPVTLIPLVAAAQETTQTPPAEPIGTLMMFTLGAALLVGVFLLVNFLRKRSNRDAMRRLNDE
jgi:hypothetical protein